MMNKNAANEIQSFSHPSHCISWLYSDLSPFSATRSHVTDGAAETQVLKHFYAIVINCQAGPYCRFYS